jgi:nucleotide-binding universal stress UspA family protein
MKTIVVGYDETDPAKRALARAAELATAFGAKVIVTSVAPMLVGRGIGPVDPVDPPEEHREELRHAAEFLAERGVEGEYQVALGDPASEIVDLAAQRRADLIVVGTRELGLLSRLLGLSVSGVVERKAHCDVLVVH